jgi:NDP-sugar pyrophosphorylase family protein
MNGKVLFAPDLEAALRVHEQSGAIATMLLKPLRADESFGAVEIDDDGRGVQKASDSLARCTRAFRCWTRVRIATCRKAAA